MAKKKAKNAKEKTKKKTTKKSAPKATKAGKATKKKAKRHKPPVWSEALAIQQAVGHIESGLLTIYMTDAGAFGDIRKQLIEILRWIGNWNGHNLICGDGNPCPPGYTCCNDGYCRFFCGIRGIEDPCDSLPPIDLPTVPPLPRW